MAATAGEIGPCGSRSLSSRRHCCLLQHHGLRTYAPRCDPHAERSSRARRPGVRDEERVPARGRASHRHRPVRLPAAHDTRVGAETISYEEQDVHEALREMSGGWGPDACIDAVGMEGHAPRLTGAYAKVKTTLMFETRSGSSASSSDLGMSERRHRLGRRRVRRVHRQIPDGRRRQPRSPSGPARRTSIAICGRCSTGSFRARSIRASSSPIAGGSTRPEPLMPTPYRVGLIRPWSALDEMARPLCVPGLTLAQESSRWTARTTRAHVFSNECGASVHRTAGSSSGRRCPKTDSQH